MGSLTRLIASVGASLALAGGPAVLAACEAWCVSGPDAGAEIAAVDLPTAHGAHGGHHGGQAAADRTGHAHHQAGHDREGPVTALEAAATSCAGCIDLDASVRPSAPFTVAFQPAPAGDYPWTGSASRAAAAFAADARPCRAGGGGCDVLSPPSPVSAPLVLRI
ncbi:MAG: hypothetical protein AB1635_13045 [Acidobacteriota bacterium]